MKIDIQFQLNQLVEICALSCAAHVEQICIGQNGTTYKVAYWFNGDRKEAWVQAIELRTNERSEKEMGL